MFVPQIFRYAKNVTKEPLGYYLRYSKRDPNFDNHPSVYEFIGRE